MPSGTWILSVVISRARESVFSIHWKYWIFIGELRFRFFNFFFFRIYWWSAIRKVSSRVDPLGGNGEEINNDHVIEETKRFVSRTREDNLIGQTQSTQSCPKFVK